MLVRNEETQCIASRNASTCMHSLYLGEREDILEVYEDFVDF